MKRAFSIKLAAVFLGLALGWAAGFAPSAGVAEAADPVTVNTSVWTLQDSHAPTYSAGTREGQPVDFTQAVYGNGRWLVVSDSNKIVQSVDGLNWSVIDRPLIANNLLFDGNRWVAAGLNGLYFSGDGVNWPDFPSVSTPVNYESVAYGSDMYVGVGFEAGYPYPHGAIYASTIYDLFWYRPQVQTTDNARVFYVTAAGGKFVALDEAGTVYSVNAGILYNWQTAHVAYLNAVAYGNNQFVGVGPSGSLYTSPDAVNWTRQALPSGVDSSLELTSIAYGGGKFVAVGAGGAILSSADGTHWTKESSPTGQRLTSVAFGGGQFVAAGDYGTIVATTNVNLKSLTLSSSSLTPGFNSGVTQYSVTVPAALSEIGVSPTTADSGASITVEGQAAANGSPINVPLDVGTNTIDIAVTGRDGQTQKTYTINVLRPSDNADLSSIGLSSGALVFHLSNDYKVTVPNEVTNLTITPIAAESHATLTVGGISVPSGGSRSVSLHVGLNSIPIVVTAWDGIAAKTYTLNITRAKSANADLQSLTVDNGTLDPVFSPSETGYTITVGHEVTDIKVTPTKADATASITVNGNPWPDQTPFNMPLSVGNNTVTIFVKAEDGTTNKRYTLTVVREPAGTPVNLASLSSLTLSEGSLSPAFTPAVTEYGATVTNSVYALSVTPTATDSAASIWVNGNQVQSGEAAAVALTEGENPISIVVRTAGGDEQTYTLRIVRASALESSFRIDNGYIASAGGLKATVTVSPAPGASPSGMQTVVFQLMNGTTPLSIAAFETSIRTPVNVSAFFNVIGGNYSVKVFVLDGFSNDPLSAGQMLALPVELK